MFSSVRVRGALAGAAIPALGAVAATALHLDQFLLLPELAAPTGAIIGFWMAPAIASSESFPLGRACAAALVASPIGAAVLVFSSLAWQVVWADFDAAISLRDSAFVMIYSLVVSPMLAPATFPIALGATWLVRRLERQRDARTAWLLLLPPWLAIGIGAAIAPHVAAVLDGDLVAADGAVLRDDAHWVDRTWSEVVLEIGLDNRTPHDRHVEIVWPDDGSSWSGIGFDAPACARTVSVVTVGDRWRLLHPSPMDASGLTSDPFDAALVTADRYPSADEAFVIEIGPETAWVEDGRIPDPQLGFRDGCEEDR